MRRLLAAALILCAAPADAQFIQNLNAPSVTIAATATLLAAARARNAITISVPSAGSTVYCGSSSLVTSSNGFPIVGGAALTLQPYNGAVWCVTASSTQAVNAIELF